MAEDDELENRGIKPAEFLLNGVPSGGYALTSQQAVFVRQERHSSWITDDNFTVTSGFVSSDGGFNQSVTDGNGNAYSLANYNGGMSPFDGARAKLDINSDSIPDLLRQSKPWQLGQY